MTIKEMAQRGHLESMVVADAHAHLGLNKSFYIPGDPSADGLVRTMDRIGIARITLSSLLAIYSDFILGNELVQQAAEKYPDRIIGLATANIHYETENVKELTHRMQHPGFKGIKIHPDFMEYSVLDPRMEDVFRIAREFGVFILSHTDARINVGHLVEYSNPAWFERLLDKFPDVPVILGHCGLTPEGFKTSIRLASKYSNAYLDTCGFRFSNAWTVEEIVAVGCGHKLLFASDLPFNDVGSALGRILYANISEEEKIAILGKNYLRILDNNKHG